MNDYDFSNKDFFKIRIQQPEVSDRNIIIPKKKEKVEISVFSNPMGLNPFFNHWKHYEKK